MTIALEGDYGKAWPALVIQSEFFAEHPSLTVLPVTSDLRATPLFRVTVEPSGDNGLQSRSQVMIDKCLTVSHDTVGPVFGQFEAARVVEIDRCLAIFLGIAR